MLEDLGRSLAAQGFQNVMVSNFHGSPRHFLAIETACDRVSRERGIRMVSIFSLMLSRLNGRRLGARRGARPHPGHLDKADLDGDTHGGLVETSQLLALHPDWVDPDYKQLPRRTVDIWLEETGRAKPPRTRAARSRRSRRWSRASRRASTTSAATPMRARRPARRREIGEQILDTLASRRGRRDRRDPRRHAAARAVALAVLEAATSSS